MFMLFYNSTEYQQQSQQKQCHYNNSSNNNNAKTSYLKIQHTFQRKKTISKTVGTQKLFLSSVCCLCHSFAASFNKFPTNNKTKTRPILQLAQPQTNANKKKTTTIFKNCFARTFLTWEQFFKLSTKNWNQKLAKWWIFAQTWMLFLRNLIDWLNIW